MTRTRSSAENEFDSERQHQLSQHFAGVALHSKIDPLATGWLRTFTANVDLAARTDWMDRVCWLLAQLPADAVEHQWQRWIHRYWTDRLEGRPRLLSHEEASAMAHWVVYLTDSIAEGVALATSHEAGIGEHFPVRR